MKQKTLAQAIIADQREKRIIEILKSLNVKVSVTQLSSADFIAGNVAIERKTHSDFVSSIIDGRIFEQVKAIEQDYGKAVVIVEGYSNRKISSDALQAAIAYLVSNHNCSIIQTKNEWETAKLIIWFAKKSKANESYFKVGKKSDKKKNMEALVASIPGISVKLAKRLLKKFKTIQALVNASETKLMQVEGIGEIKAKKIKKFFQEVYE